MDSIKKIVSKTINKIIVLWTMFFVIILGFVITYNIFNNKNQFINDQILTFSEINTEITSVLYYNSQQNIASEIDYTKTLLSQWINTKKSNFGEIIPRAIPEINFLNDLGQKFYSPETLNSKDSQIQSYQNLSDQLDLLKRMSLNHTQDSIFTKMMPLFPLICVGLLFIVVFITLLLANALQKTLMVKNEFILEDIWSELQGVELEESHQLQETNIPNPDSIKINTLIRDSKDLLHSILETKELLIGYTPTSGTITDTQLSEKISFIQKLLSRLFTRAERAATLAKAASENGFQAGILALNISIEAAKTGEMGKNFMPISDRVKDFSEKSSQLGNAILDELRDVDISIRKAYAMGKGILESMQGTEETPNHDEELQTLLNSLDQIFNLSRQMQNTTSELQTTIEIPTLSSNGKQSRFLKEILTRSFERLYRFNYGVDPANTPFDK